MRTVEAADVDAPFDIDTLRAVLREHPVQLGILFGSHAAETAHSASDIDIAVEFTTLRPSDPGYNDGFLGLSVGLSDALGTDAVDLVDLHTVSPALASSIFDQGILLVGDAEHAAELRQQLTTATADTRSPRERLDSAMARIDAHLDGDDTSMSVTGDSENER